MNADFEYKKESELIFGSVTGSPVGLIFNFKNPKLEFRRVVATTQNFLSRKS